MKQHEAAALLAVAASFDNRKPDEDAALAWSAALGNLPFDDCRDAIVFHYRESREWIMVADIVNRVRRLRSERISLGLQDIQPPARIEAIDDPNEFDRAYRAWLQGVRDQAARGLPVVSEPRQLMVDPPKEAKDLIDGLNRKLDAEGSDL